MSVSIAVNVWYHVLKMMVMWQDSAIIIDSSNADSDNDCAAIVPRMTSSEGEHIDCDLTLSEASSPSPRTSPVKKRIK